MTILKTTNPTGSYNLEIPADICEDNDDRVVSYWKEGQEVLLQLSSYARSEGNQISATDRLNDRLNRERLSNVMREEIFLPSCPDWAAASGNDEQGCRWIFLYAVWPDLTVLATISGTSDILKLQGAWAFKAIQSLKRTN